MLIKQTIGENNKKIDEMLIDIIVTDNKFECIALYDLPVLKKGDELIKPLTALNPYSIQLSTQKEGFYKLSNYYAYEIVGKLYDKKRNIITVGDILIELDNSIPADIKEDTMVEFKCDRLDV